MASPFQPLPDEGQPQARAAGDDQVDVYGDESGKGSDGTGPDPTIMSGDGGGSPLLGMSGDAGDGFDDFAG